MNTCRNFTTLLTCFALLQSPLAVANPANGIIKFGDGEINFDTENAVFIHQDSDKLIIDWESFSIDPGELTKFLQPNSSSAALNRVFSGDPSAIHGQLQANGRVLLLNPNGILVGPNGQIDTAGFVASTLNLSDSDFLDGGDMTFFGNSTAAVTNLGTINAIDGGDIFLIAREVRNAGTLNAPEGTVGMAAGSEVVIAAEGEERILITPDGQNASVTNEGVVRAATAELKAAGGNPYALAINNTGLVRATKFQNRGGKLYLSASGGRIVNSGSLRASSSVSIRQTGQSGDVEIGGSATAQDEITGNGGEVEISGPNVALLPGSSVNASGNEAGQVAIRATVIGGKTQIGGSVAASASAGDGGLVSVTGETIEVSPTGRIEANGAQNGGLLMLGVNPAAPSTEIPTNSAALAASSLLSANGGAGNGGDVLLFGTGDGEMSLGGMIRVNGGGGNGGQIVAIGGDITVQPTALLQANGEIDGGFIQLEGEGDVIVGGRVDAAGAEGSGGRIALVGENVTLTQTGVIDAGGETDGGFVSIQGGEDGIVSVAGQIRAIGQTGDGGMIQINGGDVVVAQTGLLDVSGGANGGFIQVEAQNNATFNGTARAIGGSGDGGVVEVLGENVTLGSTALIDASGGVNGGQVFVGGGRKGRDPNRRNAQNTTVANGARIVANGGEAGGEVVLWADGAMDFRGSVVAEDTKSSGSGSETSEFFANSATGEGSGGFVEVSGLEYLNFAGHVDTGGGQLLLDPFNYTIGAAEAGAIVAALANNNVTIDTTQDVGAQGSSGNAADTGIITVNSNLFYDSPNDLTFLAMADLIFNASVQNRNDTDGDINLVAGWDGTTAYNTATFAAEDVTNTTVFGNNMGSVFIGTGNQTQGIAVGSRSGATNAFGYDVNVLGATNSDGDSGTTGDNTRFGHLGFRITNGTSLDGTNLGSNAIVDGDITIHAMNSLSAIAGNDVDNYAKVGHVGPDRSGDRATPEAAASSDIEISTGGDIDFRGGSGISATAQLGQGGDAANGNFTGTITITRAGDLNFLAGDGSAAYVQLGNGGFAPTGSSDPVGNKSGTILILDVNDILFMGGGGRNSYTHLGNGGRAARGNNSGDVTIVSANDIIFQAGTGDFSTASFGQHGGNGTTNNSGSATITRARDIRFIGGSGIAAYAHLGQESGSSGNQSGDVTIGSIRDLTLQGGSGTGSYVRLGQGGADSGPHSGTIEIGSARDISLLGGAGSDTLALIGHGSDESSNGHGSISIGSAQDISLLAGAGGAHAQIGHLGVGAHSGDVMIGQVNDVTLRTTNDEAEARIGHQSGGVTGNISIQSARDIELDASQTTHGTAQIGHGGSGDQGGDILIERARNLRVAAGVGSTRTQSKKGTSFTVQNPSNASVGHGGGNGDSAANASGEITVNLTEDLEMTATTPNVAGTPRIGHKAVTTVSRDITVEVGGDATLSPEAVIGHVLQPRVRDIVDGTYDSGDTDLRVDGILTARAGAQFASSPNGMLNVQVPNPASFQAEAGVLFNDLPFGGPGSPLPGELLIVPFGGAGGGGDPLPKMGNRPTTKDIPPSPATGGGGTIFVEEAGGQLPPLLRPFDPVFEQESFGFDNPVEFVPGLDDDSVRLIPDTFVPPPDPQTTPETGSGPELLPEEGMQQSLSSGEEKEETEADE